MSDQPAFLGRVHAGDCRDVLAAFPDGCVDLCFADPPFNLGIDYANGYDDRRPLRDYLAMLEAAFRQVRRVLTPEGSLWVATAEDHAHRVRLLLEDLGFFWRGTVVWHYTFGPHQKSKFGRDHTPLLYMIRHPKRFTFNADAVRVESARQRLGDRRADPRGRVPGDVWTFSRVCGTFRERVGHACQMPVKLLERVVKACSDVGDVVLDPFAGTGTTLEAAARLGRRWVGVELSESTADLARRRLEGLGAVA